MTNNETMKQQAEQVVEFYAAAAAVFEKPTTRNIRRLKKALARRAAI
jgi:hypothetical protein